MCLLYFTVGIFSAGRNKTECDISIMSEYTINRLNRFVLGSVFMCDSLVSKEPSNCFMLIELGCKSSDLFSKNHRSWSSPLYTAFEWGDGIALTCWQTGVKTVYRVRAVCVEYACHFSRSLLTPICWLISYSTAAKQGPGAIISGQDPPFTQCQGAKNQCLLILSAVTLEQQLEACFYTQTLIHGQAGSFILLWCLVNGFTYPCSVWSH